MVRVQIQLESAQHRQLTRRPGQLLERERPIRATSFVHPSSSETMALLQHRIGLAAARGFDEDIIPVLEVEWVDEQLYRRGADRLWRADRASSASWTAWR